MLRRFTVHLVAAVAGVGVLAVCSETNSPVPRSTAQPSASELPAVGARGFTIMTRNLKFGGSLTEFAGSTDPVPVRWAKLWADVQAFDFPERAGTFAREIAETSPALVGLQEVPLFRTQTPSDGGTTPATGVLMDFLSILEDSLAARGLSYRVAAVNATTDVELPMLVAGTIDQYVDLRYIDRDVILARNDVATDDPNGAKYAARISLTLPDGTRVRSERGWVSTRATLGGVMYRIVSTHLERGTGSLVGFNEAQATELITILRPETLPLILVCDCNSPAGQSAPRSYGWLVAAAEDGGGGFLDAWPEANPFDAGYTARLPDNLVGPANLTERLDLILVRQGFHAAPAAGIVGGVHAVVIGEEPDDLTPSGRWPSDHAGVVATFRMPKALGSR
jgi:hypothetical protein